MFIGIDVALKHLDAAATEVAARLPHRVPNTPEGIARLVTALGAVAPDLVVLEATGTYHLPLLAALLAAEVPVSVANPAQVAAFRQSRLGRHKSPETVILTAQAGVGLMTAAAVLAYLPAGVLGNPKAAAAYAGLHPRHEQSGQRDHSRLSKQGSPPLRRYLYLAAMSAIRYDPEIASWYHCLCARGKAAQSATCAVAHKLLRRMMGRIHALRQQRPVILPLAA
jgi:transposase